MERAALRTKKMKKKKKLGLRPIVTMQGNSLSDGDFCSDKELDVEFYQTTVRSPG